MWRYGAMALVALTFSNENILFLEKYQHIHHDRINYIDPGPCHGLVIKQKNGNQKQAFVLPLLLIFSDPAKPACSLNSLPYLYKLKYTYIGTLIL